jgi:hypothetical protein
VHVQEDGCGTDDGKEDSELLSVHLIYYESGDSSLWLISPSRIFNWFLKSYFIFHSLTANQKIRYL